MSKKPIRVRAKNPGLYGHLRTEGDQFHLQDEGHFSGRWMEHVDEEGCPVENSAVQKRYDEALAEKNRPAQTVNVNVIHGKPRPAVAGPSGPGMHDDLGVLDASGTPVINDASHPTPGITDPGQRAQIEAIVDHQTNDENDKAHKSRSSNRPSDKKAI